MKKLVFGCGAVILLLALVGGAAAYVFVYRPARALIAAGSELVTSMNRITELDAGVINTARFEPPADNALTAAQVTRFAAAMEALHATMGARAAELEVKYKALENGGNGAPSLPTLVGAYRDLFGLVLDAKKAQVEALNGQRFSVAEYHWVKARIYEAAGVEITGIDFQELAAQAGNGNFDELSKLATRAREAANQMGQRGHDASPAHRGSPTTVSAPVGDAPGVGIPDVNRRLVAPHKERVATWLAYAMFGL